MAHQQHLDLAAATDLFAAQARGDHRGVVDDEDVAFVEEIDDVCEGPVMQHTVEIEMQQPRR